MDVELHTPRLRLRQQRAGDIPAIIAGLNDWEVVRWLTVVPYPYTQADAEEWIGRQTPPVPGHAHFGIELSGSGLIGVVTLDDQLGYWLLRAKHGQGYMTEACTALLEWHFSTRPADVVPSGYHAGNVASAAVQRKLGFVETGERDMRFVRSQRCEVEHIGTSLSQEQFAASPAMRGRV
jgi:RimJ/RimL family protein N-acetyltransferase